MHDIDVSLLHVIFLCFAFFIAGFVDAISGGGGAISLPSLLLFGIPTQYALGINKFGLIFSTFTALVNYVRHGGLNLKLALAGVLFGLIGSVMGSRAVMSFDSTLALKVIVFLLPIAAVVSILPRKERPAKEITNLDLLLFMPLIATVIGFYDGFFGPGTGGFLILACLFILKIDILQASVQSKAVNLATNVGSLITFIGEGRVVYYIAVPAAICSTLGAYMGSRMVVRHGLPFVKIMLFVVFVLLFFILLFRYVI